MKTPSEVTKELHSSYMTLFYKFQLTKCTAASIKMPELCTPFEFEVTNSFSGLFPYQTVDTLINTSHPSVYYSKYGASHFFFKHSSSVRDIRVTATQPSQLKCVT
jgi:hypothetical protein